MKQISLDKAYQVYKDRFADAGNFTFTFVGSFDVNAIKPLLEKYLGSLPATNRHEQAKDLNIYPPEGRIEKTVYKGSEPKASVYLLYSGNYQYSAENDVKMDAMREVLQIRLIQRLREDEGGVYAPSVQESTDLLPEQRFSYVIRFGCAPENVEKLIASTLDEINKLKTVGPLQENIDKWRVEEKTSMQPLLRTNNYWLGYLTEQLQNGQELDEINTHDALLDKVTSADVKAMAEKYLNGENYIRLVLMPENVERNPGR